MVNTFDDKLKGKSGLIGNDPVRNQADAVFAEPVVDYPTRGSGWHGFYRSTKHYPCRSMILDGEHAGDVKGWRDSEESRDNWIRRFANLFQKFL